jgi:hypothetical protein
MLKTFFVGFGYEATTSDFADTIADIAPLMFTVINATGAFTEAGGTYHLEVVSCVDGTARLPQYSKVGNTISFQGQATLKDTIAAFQDTIQANYDYYFTCVQSQLGSAFADAGIDLSLVSKAISPVKYVIDLNDMYKSSTYLVNDAPEQTTNTTMCPAPVQVHLPNHISIEDGIHYIMSMSTKVKTDAAEGIPSAGDNTLKKYTYKIRTAVRTEPIGGTGKDKQFNYTVYYKVEPFMAPKDVANAHAFMGLATKEGQAKAVSDPNLASNIINFEYLYTGKNVDILEFDIKLNAGLAYLQTATTANSYRGQLEKTQSKSSATSAIDLSQFARGGDMVPRPVFFGSQIRAPLAKNTQNANITIQAAYTMTKHASIELTEATMRIYGNPNLLSSVTATSDSDALMTTSNDSVVSQLPSEPVTNADFTHWGKIPAFAKVKIKMPRNNDDILAFSGGTSVSDQNMGNLDYAQDFWFDGYYYVMGIDHSFENGEFTQTLHMLGIVPDDALTAITGQKLPEPPDLTKNINDCYDSIMGCGEQPSAPAKSSAVPPSSVPKSANGAPVLNTPPADRSTADIINATAMASNDLSQIIGWDNATADVKQAILGAAAKYDVNAFTLAQICAAESNPPFSAGSKNSDPIGSHAAGLFQFVHDTWIKYYPISSTNSIPFDPGALDPYANADAGARLMRDNIKYLGGTPTSTSNGGFTAGDVYLMHVNGGWGPNAIEFDNVGQGDITLHDLFVKSYSNFDKEWRIQYTNSPTNQKFFNEHNSATGIRQWAAQTVAKHLKNGTVPTAGTAFTQKTMQTPSGTKLTSIQARDALANMKPCPPDTATAKKEDQACNKVATASAAPRSDSSQSNTSVQSSKLSLASKMYVQKNSG